MSNLVNMTFDNNSNTNILNLGHPLEAAEFMSNSTIFPYDSKYAEISTLHDFFSSDKCRQALNFLHINCRSVNKNFEKLLDLLHIINYPLTAIALTETWLSSDNEYNFHIPGYKFIANSRTDKSAGGIGIFLNNDLDYVVRTDLNRMASSIESLFIEVLENGRSCLLLGCIYRPPNSDVNLFNVELLNILKMIDSANINIAAIAGDFNLDLIKNDRHVPTAEFLNNMLSYSFYPSVNKPTRITEVSATLLDNIFIRQSALNFMSAIVYSDISDHMPVALHLKHSVIKKIDKTYINKRTFDEKSLIAFNCELNNSDLWNDVYIHANINKNAELSYNCFFSIYKAIFDKYFPKTTCKLSHRLTPRHFWMTKGLVRSCLKKASLYKKYKKSGKIEDKNKYLSYQKILKNLLGLAAKNYYSEKFKLYSSNLCKTWKLLGSIINKRISNDDISSLKINDSLVSNTSEIVEKLNEYFVNIGADISRSVKSVSVNFKQYLNGTYINSFGFLPADTNEIIKIVSSLENKSSSGIDEIPIKIMKSTIFSIAGPLTAIINCSLQTGCFPDALKIAKVIPLYKNGDKTILQNYRPISILPSFSKIFEKIVFNRLISYLDFNKILCNGQYGFRKNHSTFMALIDMYDKISASIDRKEFSIGIFIDLAKAFDVLDHNILLSKLEHYGIRGICLEWFKSYLSNRKQCVVIKDNSSTLKDISHGVPQGSILGPLLFILYVNDIVHCSSTLAFILFADDTNLFYSNPDINVLFQIVNLELSKLDQWFKANKLSLNVKKSSYMLFGSKHVPNVWNNLFLTIDGNELTKVESIKFLGIYIDAKLTWKKHIGYIASKISQSLGAIGRARKLLPQNILLMLYHSMIYPYLTYCNIVWGSANPTVIKRLEILQKRAVRIVTNSSFNSTSGPLFFRLKLLKLSDIVNFQTAQFMFKVKNNLLPIICNNYVTVASMASQVYVTRHHSFFNILGCRTGLREKSLKIRGPKIWNRLPVLIQNLCSFLTFKRELFSLYINSYS